MQSMLLRDIWDLLNLGQSDPINQMITISVITSSDFHCIFVIPVW